MDWMSIIFHITEIIGTFAFAVSGAMVAVKSVWICSVSF